MPDERAASGCCKAVLIADGPWLILCRQGLVHKANSPHPFRLTSAFTSRLQRDDLRFPDDLFEEAAQADEALDAALLQPDAGARRPLLAPNADANCGSVAQALQRLAAGQLDLEPRLMPRQAPTGLQRPWQQPAASALATPTQAAAADKHRTSAISPRTRCELGMNWL